MNKRLFNDNAGETLTPDGQRWSATVETILHPLMKKAVEEGISIRDLTTVVMDEIAVLTAESLIRKGIKERSKRDQSY